ncbi:zinc ribbon domain-containing protein, partial [Halobacillus alkaliphilus]|uniref:zinc ribbon domain-containing protein n=2 Tax=Halobacillus alkaliphilus TaxID=396056 RepID=UPI001113F0FC
FKSFLKYKLNEQGKHLIKIDKWYPSTQTCSHCGNTKPMPMNIRTYTCSCGVNLDRDYNSALNIKKEGIRLLALL